MADESTNTKKTIESLKKITANLFEKEIKNTKKFSKSLEDLGENMAELLNNVKEYEKKDPFKNLSKIPNLAKNVNMLGTSFKEFNDKLLTAENKFRELGIVGEQHLKKIKDEAEKTNSSINKFVKSGDAVSKLNGFFKNTANILASAKKGFEDISKSTGFQESLKRYSGSLENLQGTISDTNINDLKSNFEKLEKVSSFEELTTTLKELKDSSDKINVSQFLSDEDNNRITEFKNSTQLLIDTFKKIPKTTISTKDIFKELESIDMEEMLSSLPDDIKESFSKIKEELSKPTVDVEDALKRISDILDKGGEYFKKFNDTASDELSKARNSVKKITTDLEKHLNYFNQPFALSLSTQFAEDRASDFIKEIQRRSLDFEVMDIVSNEDIIQSNKILESQKKLENLRQDMEANIIEILNKEQDEVTTKTELKKVQMEYLDLLGSEVRKMQDIETSGYNVLKAREKMAAFGTEHTDKLAASFSTISATFGIFSDKTKKWSPTFSEGLSKVAGRLGELGTAMRALSGPVGIMMGAMSLLKKTIDFEVEFKKMRKDVGDTGVAVGVSAANMGASLTKSLDNAINLAGNTRAAMGKIPSEFTTTRDEILGVVKSLDQAGIASRTLDAKMANVKTTVAGAGNSLLGATNIVKTFSTNLGITDTEMASLAGNMAFEFNSTMSGIKDNFTGITNAVHNSGMSTNKFLGILGTATAGLALYEDQVVDTANMIAKLAKNTNLTGSDLEKTAKTLAEFAGNSDNVSRALAVLASTSTAGFDSFKKMMEEKLSAKQLQLQTKLSAVPEGPAGDKERAMLEAELKNLSTATKHLSSGDLVNFGSDMKMLPTEITGELVFGLEQAVKGISGDNTRMYEDLMKSMGIGELANTMRKTGLSGKDLKDALAKKPGEEEVPKTAEEMQQAAMNYNRETASAAANLVKSAEDTARTYFGPMLSTLEKILAAVVALSALVVAGKFLDKIGGFLAGPLDKAVGPLARSLAKIPGLGGLAGTTTVGGAAAAGGIGLAVGGAMAVGAGMYMSSLDSDLNEKRKEAIADTQQRIEKLKKGISLGQEESSQLESKLKLLKKQNASADDIAKTEKELAIVKNKIKIKEDLALTFLKSIESQKAQMTDYSLMDNIQNVLGLGGQRADDEAMGGGYGSSTYSTSPAKTIPPKMQTGGSVEKTGLYTLHKGEVVIPNTPETTPGKAGPLPSNLGAGGGGKVNIIINGGDLIQVRRVIREELQNAGIRGA